MKQKNSRREICKMDKQDMPEYETICAAVAGEAWAVEKIVAHYADYIAEICSLGAVASPQTTKKRKAERERTPPQPSFHFSDDFLALEA